MPFFSSIDKRRNEVLERRQGVKDKAAERHNALLGSQAFQEFKRDAAEVSQVLRNYSGEFNYDMFSVLVTIMLLLITLDG